MGVGERQRAVCGVRGQIWSPGRPTVARREDRVGFWQSIAAGVSSTDAAAVVGVSPAVGSRWFRDGGGMPPMSLVPLSGRYLSFAEREEIAILHAQRVGVREIARRLSRSASTVSRELRRNASTRSHARVYRATTAQWHAERRASRPKVSKLAANDALREYVQERLAGAIARPEGEPVPGPDVGWVGRRLGRRKDRRWAKAWSPEQIANRLRTTSPMMSRCGSRTRRSTSRSSFRAGARSSASSLPAYGPDGRCGCRAHALGRGGSSSSAPS
jgi:transposase